MPLTPGVNIGPYEIVASLGAGGMGELYRARDTVLGRDVAIKVLPEAFAADPERLARFQREARVLATLNHPHVGIIYGIEQFGGRLALVLELIDGDTLEERIRRGPLPVAEALRIASQIATALQAAHKRGIVHRDLKPANIKVTSEGTVKVLDFGLAKIAHTPSGLAELQTMAAATTIAGGVLGTAGYMSPEQARAEVVDARTDVWALGCVLYELLAGRRAFDGRTASDMIVKVLEHEPEWTALPRSTPPAVLNLLKRCLSKDSHARPQDMAAVQALLEWGQVSPQRPAILRPLTIATAVFAVVALALFAYQRLGSNPVPVTDASQWEQITNFPDAATQPTLSPDGGMLAFVRGESTFAARGEIYLKHLPGGEATALTRDGEIKMDPVFSPDGNRIAYTRVGDASMSSGWDTWHVPVVRGEPQPWLRNASGLRWIRQDLMLFSQIRTGYHMGIVTANEGRRDVRELYFPADPRSMAHRSALSPDGRWLLVVEMDTRGVFAPCVLVRVDRSTPSQQVGPVPSRCTNAAWAPDGRRMFFTADSGQGFHLWEQSFPDGQPRQMTSGGATEEEGLAIAPDGGSLITSVGHQRRGIWVHDGSGERQISLEGYAFWPLFSADGQKICFRVSRSIASGNMPSELWITDLTSGRAERLLPGQLVTQYDLSRDDRIVAAVTEADGKSRLWIGWLDGRDAPKRLGNFEGRSPRVGPAGEVLFTATVDGTTALFSTTFEGAPARRLSPQESGGILGSVSPDGRWVSVNQAAETKAVSTTGDAPVPILGSAISRLRWTPDGTRALLAVQLGASSAWGFGRTYVLTLQPGETLPPVPPGGFTSEAQVAALPGVEVIPYGDVAFSLTPGVYAFSKITVTRNLYRIRLD